MNSSYLFLNEFTDLALTTSSGNMFQCGTILFVKKFFLCGKFLLYCMLSLCLLPLMPLAGPKWLIKLVTVFGLNHSILLNPFTHLKYWKYMHHKTHFYPYIYSDLSLIYGTVCPKSVFYGASFSKYLGFNGLHPSTRDYGTVHTFILYI